MIEGDPIEQAKASGFKVEITRKGSSQTPPPAPKQVSEILQTLQLLTPVDGVFEVRGVKPRPLSGYFDAEHLEEAARRIEALDESGASEGLYWTINEVNPALLSRRANRIEMRLAPGAPTTADADIVRRRWLLVDIDPDRPSGISSTDEEHKRALDMAGRVSGFLREFYGFPDPILADSGNGAHLMYRIDLPNDDESTTLITRCLKALGNAFNGQGCEIDQKVFNAARIGRLYGTVARKGDHTPERPHRRSNILEIPEIMKAVPRDALATLAALAQEEEQPRTEPRNRSGSNREIDLADWLQEHGRGLPAYQEKPKPPWRYFYVFDTCPWDPSHRDRSAWVGQLSSGPLAAGCQHNGCAGKGWADLRALVDDRPKPAPVRREARADAPAGAPTPTPVAAGSEAAPGAWPGGEATPSICTTGVPIHEMSETALAVVNQWNSPPELFARSACLVRTALDEKQGLYIQEVDENGLTGILDRLITWYRRLKDGDERPAHPPREVVRDILSLPAAAWRVPHLAGVTATPVSHPDGTIHTTPGYDEETGLYYAPADGFALPPVPEVPTREDVAAALKTIEEVFVDFPFCSPADRANAIGALLTAVLRPCIDGPVPLYLTDKPQAGSGAGLLQRVIGWIAEGREPALKTMPTGLEMRKEIFASLRNGTRIQIFDNLEDRLSSPELAAALTAVEMTGRILGQTEERTYAVRCFWMVNGNNVTVGGDLARRTFKSRVDPQDPMPWQREGFRHPDLIRWVQEARGRILAAVFTLARAWIQAGRPAPEKVPRVGSFEAWRDMIGGVLERAGVPDFMGNANEVYLAADEDRMQWENFLQALWNRYGSEPFQPGRVAELLTSQDPAGFPIADSLPDALAEAFHYKRKSFSQVLGMAFKKVDGRHFPGGWCVRQGKWSRGVRTWVVTYAPPTPTPEVVQPWCNLDSSKSGADCQTEEPSSPVRQSGVSGVTCTLPTRKKKSSYKTVMDNGNIPDTNVCAIGSGRLHHLHPDPPSEDKPETDNKSGQYPAASRLHQGYTTPTNLPPPPPGCLKHPIDQYERRKYDSSIVCMVPGCKRPAAYGCGAGFPLCEGHYQAAKQQVARRGGDPR